MANPLPHEAKLYQRINDENIEINPKIWTLIYEHMGNAVTMINLTTNYYLQLNKPLPINEAKRILDYTRDINHTLDCILYPDKNYLEDDLFKQVQEENINLHSVVRELLTHYIGNDIFSINLVIGDCIDPLAPQDVPLDYLPKIIERTHSLREFLDRLREATLKMATF